MGARCEMIMTQSLVSWCLRDLSRASISGELWLTSGACDRARQRQSCGRRSWRPTLWSTTCLLPCQCCRHPCQRSQICHAPISTSCHAVCLGKGAQETSPHFNATYLKCEHSSPDDCC